MAKTARTAKHIIQTYKAVLKAKQQTQAKLQALLDTNPFYKLFESDKKHPYFALAHAGVETFNAYESLLAGVLDWMLDGVTIAEELDKVKAYQIVNEEEADEDLDALRLIKAKTMSESEAAEKLLEAYLSASAAWSQSSEKVINQEIAMLHGRRGIALHKEKPQLKVTTECGTAVREIRKLSKEIRELGNGASTIRRELEKMNVMRALRGQSKLNAIEFLLKP